MASPEASILGSDLAVLSLKVAVQVDRKLGGRTIDQSPFTDFGKELSKATGITDEPAKASFLQSNPTASEVLARAISEVSTNQVSNVDDLVSEIGSFLQKLKGEAAQQSDEDLSKLKHFCLSLHKSMMSQKTPPSFESDNGYSGRLGFIR